ncbi:pyocin activator PrtN family protein [Ruegeria faecimaris]|uniref:pyocin activator PrtN family protein n=1 Tax=Ruegeria faecimaris TaxID=686389 RepID=UPI00232FC2CE|nr:pyocin activator PrtN family protein [Ruegeria faecimaris]
MQTIFMLMGRYDARVMVPLEAVRQDFFPELSLNLLKTKTDSGEIPLVVTRLGSSQKSGRMVHVKDLADFLDEQVKKARTEARRKAA